MVCNLLQLACLFCATALAGCAGGDTNNGAQPSPTSGDNEQHINTLATTPTPSPVDCVGRLPKARLILAKEGYKRGAEEFERVIEMGCDSAYARYEFGRALREDKQYSRAVEQLRISIRMDPKEWAPQNLLAVTLMVNLEEFEEGLRELEKARNIDDLDDLAYSYDYYEGRALEGLGKLQAALIHFRKFERRQSEINKNDEELIDAKKRIAKLEAALENSGT
ncbi:MAG: tetratricopeptide repeat protein [Pyrinomonadaceae bacterium]